MSILDVVLAPVKAKAKLIGLVVGGGALVAIGILGWYYWNDYKNVKADLETRTSELTQKKAEVKNLAETVKTQAASKKIDDDTQTKVDVGVKEVDKTTTTIADTHARNIKKIQAKYEALPQTDANTKAKEDEISRDRISRLWDVFCIANPEKAQCVPQSASAASR